MEGISPTPKIKLQLKKHWTATSIYVKEANPLGVSKASWVDMPVLLHSTHCCGCHQICVPGTLSYAPLSQQGRWRQAQSDLHLYILSCLELVEHDNLDYNIVRIKKVILFDKYWITFGHLNQKVEQLCLLCWKMFTFLWKCITFLMLLPGYCSFHLA